jgi:hypothetical protein
MTNDNKRRKLDPSLIIDSGCARSIVTDTSMLQEFRTITTTMNTANYTSLICTGIGKLPTARFTLQDVLYSPNLAFNLLSVAQIADLDLYIIFDKFSCRIYNTETNQIVMEAPRDGNLYIYRPSNKDMALLSTTSFKTVRPQKNGTP